MSALKIISGVIVPNSSNRDRGEVELTFDPLSAQGDGTFVETSVSGAAGRFETPPGKVVSIRYFTEDHGDSSINLTDSVPTRDNMTIDWDASHAEVREISVLIVGEA